MKYPNITTLNECFLSKKHKRRQIQQLKGSWFVTRCNTTQIYPTASNAHMQFGRCVTCKHSQNFQNQNSNYSSTKLACRLKATL